MKQNFYFRIYRKISTRINILISFHSFKVPKLSQLTDERNFFCDAYTQLNVFNVDAIWLMLYHLPRFIYFYFEKEEKKPTKFITYDSLYVFYHKR